ncbi:MAG: acyl--CoA ligase [Candidatus Thiodiazotropha sp. (ex Monitilora ramsayi)]|nr:acyl--CoA ligase [Candidatus Thiodiazotropha sp. (ex Monitilora ramsayi)]
MSLVDRFKQTLLHQPDTLAVVQGIERTTYGSLGILSANVAGYLLENEIEREDRVALILANSAHYIAIYYGVWCAGGVTVALNTQAKTSDFLNWLNHSGARWLFIDDNHPELNNLRDREISGIHIIPVGSGDNSRVSLDDSTWHSIVSSDYRLPDVEIQSSSLASIIYTSGTTGKPKGVTLSHGNLESNIDSILEYLKLNTSDSIVNVLPFYYSYGNSIMHIHIAVGAKLVLENNLLYPHKVLDLIESESVTGFSGVPSTFSLILGRVDLTQYSFPSLRYVTQAGGPMPPALVDRLIDAMPEIDLFVMYGQTEATARLTYLPPGDLSNKRGSIGYAIPSVTIRIVNKLGKNVAVGETGEIIARGPNIMQCYWKDPEKTHQVIKNGWLHTGDLAHYDSDGYIYIDGRSSDMIKSGGNRISPKEIEEVIQELEGVQEVAVVGIPNEVLGETIKAYIVPKVKSDLKKMAVQRHCKENLAVYKIPKTVEFITELPKTASGKIQRFALQRSD